MYWVTATELRQAGMQRGELCTEKQSDLCSVLRPPLRYLNTYVLNSSWHFKRKKKLTENRTNSYEETNSLLLSFLMIHIWGKQTCTLAQRTWHTAAPVKQSMNWLLNVYKLLQHIHYSKCEVPSTYFFSKYFHVHNGLTHQYPLFLFGFLRTVI